MAKKTKSKTKNKNKDVVKYKVKKQKTKKKKKSTKNSATKYAPMDLDTVYSLINQAQIRKVEQYLFISKIDAPMIENIIKDCNITFTKIDKFDAFHYVIQPPPEEKITEEDFDFDDDYQDEIKDDEQCF